jgi:hypothetical protein
LLLSGAVTEPVELLQHQKFEHEHWVERQVATLLPVAHGVTGEPFEQRAEAFPRNDIAQLMDASAFGGDGLFVFDVAEKAPS